MRLTPLARRLGSVALVTSLGLGLVACSSDDDSSSAKDSATSAEKSTDDGTDNGTDDSTTGSPEETEEATAVNLSAKDFYPSMMAAIREEGSFAFETITESAGEAADEPSTMSGQARFAGDSMDMKASSSGPQGMEMVMVDQVIYMKSPEMGLGSKWLKLDLKNMEGSMFGMLAKATDPEAMFKAMETPEQFELVGEEEIEGVATKRYRITVDTEQYAKAMQLPDYVVQVLPDKQITEMWIDADNLPRKFVQVTEVPAMAGGKSTTNTTTGTYSDYGLDVDISAPPASEVDEDALEKMGVFGGA